MSAKTSIVYVLPGKMGGVVTNLSNLQESCDRGRFSQHTVLTRSLLDRDTPYEGRMASDEETQFVHSLPLENLHGVLRRFGKTIPSGGGVLVSSDWLELGWVCARGTERAVIQILHGDFDYYYDLALRHHEVVDVFVACSQRIHEKLVGLLPSRKESIHYIPYGVPIPKEGRKPARGPLKLLYAGRLEQGQKRIFDLPRIDEALRKRSVRVEWTIAGGGPDENALREQWTERSSVRWPGVLSNRETVDLMKGQDLFVLPSVAEGLPLALLEAMSVGLVPVVSDIPSGVPEVVVPGKTGFRIAVGDVEAFAVAVAAFDRDRSSLESLSVSARRLVSERFDVRLQASRYQELFEKWRELLRPKPRKPKIPYGSRLDRPWIPNAVVQWIRGRTRPELRALLQKSDRAHPSRGRA
ncbi:MAG: glycosyltransferase family 4 protein [Vicinamibacteria bacterium]